MEQPSPHPLAGGEGLPLPSMAPGDGGAGIIPLASASDRAAGLALRGDGRYGHALQIGAAAAAAGGGGMGMGMGMAAPSATPLHVLHPDTGLPLLDHRSCPLTVQRMLGTRPLRADVSTRPGAGGMKYTYMGGEAVTRTLNEVFGFGGWSMEVKETKREECNKDSKDRYLVHYTALVRITHLATGSYREDFGACDSLDRSLGTAVSHALKGAVTDAMKRASRHFGDKLGNSLYDSRFKASMAPTTLRQALDLHDLEYNKRTFFDRDRAGGGTGTSGTGTKVEGGATMGGAAAAAPPGAALPSGKAVAPAPPAALAAAPGPQWRRRQPPSAAAPPALPQQQARKQAPPPSAWQGLRGSGLCGTGAAGPDPEEADFGGAAFDSALLADVTNAVPPRPSTARGGRPGGTATATATVMGGGGPMAGRKRPHASAGEGGGRGGGLPPGNPYGAPRQQNV